MTSSAPTIADVRALLANELLANPNMAGAAVRLDEALAALPSPSASLALPAELGDPLTSPIAQVLGMSVGEPWTLTRLAHAFRDNGVALPHKAEAEYAYVLHWLLTLAIQHGDGWRFHAAERLEQLKPAHAAACEQRRAAREAGRRAFEQRGAH